MGLLGPQALEEAPMSEQDRISWELCSSNTEHAGHSGHGPNHGGRTFYCSSRAANMDNVQKGEIGLCVNEKYIFLYKGIFSNTRK